MLQRSGQWYQSVVRSGGPIGDPVSDPLDVLVGGPVFGLVDGPVCVVRLKHVLLHTTACQLQMPGDGWQAGLCLGSNIPKEPDSDRDRLVRLAVRSVVRSLLQSAIRPVLWSVVRFLVWSMVESVVGSVRYVVRSKHVLLHTRACQLQMPGYWSASSPKPVSDCP